MLVEMLLLVLLAAAVFAFVLAPLVRFEGKVELDIPVEQQPAVVPEEKREPVAADGQPVRDTP